MSKSVTSIIVRKEIKKVVKDQKQEDKIISLFWDLDAFSSFLEKNDVLQVLIDYLPQNFAFTRYEFYTHYISTKNSIEDNLLDLLRKVAVSMELLQLNELDIKELTIIFSLLDNTDESTVDEVLSSELTQISSEKKFSFIHHTVQEFLAVQYIENHENSIETFRKFALLETEKIKAIKPSWLNVIRLLLEGTYAQNVLSIILRIATEDSANVNEQFADSLSSFNPQHITPEQQKDLFYLIYDTYLEKAIWLPTWASKNIWQIAPKNAIKTIKDLFGEKISNTKKAVNIGNAIPIISGIIENKPDYIQDEEYWKNKE